MSRPGVTVAPSVWLALASACSLLEEAAYSTFPAWSHFVLRLCPCVFSPLSFQTVPVLAAWCQWGRSPPTHSIPIDRDARCAAISLAPAHSLRFPLLVPSLFRASRCDCLEPVQIDLFLQAVYDLLCTAFCVEEEVKGRLVLTAFYYIIYGTYYTFSLDSYNLFILLSNDVRLCWTLALWITEDIFC